MNAAWPVAGYLLCSFAFIQPRIPIFGPTKLHPICKRHFRFNQKADVTSLCEIGRDGPKGEIRSHHDAGQDPRGPQPIFLLRR